MPSTNLEFADWMLPKLAADGSNWVIWKYRIKIFLKVNGLKNHLDHSTPPPVKPQPLNDDAKEDEIKEHQNQTEEYRRWKQVDAVVELYIVSTIPDSIFIALLHCKTSKDLWEAICAEQQARGKILGTKLVRQLREERCTDPDDVRVHVAKMARLCDEIAMSGKKLEDADFVSILTNSLPRSYDNIKSTLSFTASALDKVPDAWSVIRVVEEEYDRRQARTSGSSAGSSVSAAPDSSSQGQSSSRRKRNICTNTRCRSRHNHEFKDCRSPGGPLRGRDTPQEMEYSESDSDVTGPLFLGGAVVDPAPPDPSKRLEVYSTAVSCHMSPYRDAFTDFVSIDPRPISLANGRTIEAVGKGSMNITVPNGDKSSVILLRNVLYVPTMASTYVSVSRVVSAGFTARFQGGKLRFFDPRKDDKVVGIIHQIDRLWAVEREASA